MANPTWFDASADRLYRSAIATAAELGYSVKHSDPAGRIISFNTGMSMRSWAGQDMSVSVIEGQNGKNGVVVGGHRAQLAASFGGPPQVFDWGEKGKITRKFMESFIQVLARTQESVPPAPAGQTAANPSATVMPQTIFEPEGVYGGVPFRAVGSGIEALMSGILVRFRSVEQFVAAVTGKTSTK